MTEKTKAIVNFIAEQIKLPAKKVEEEMKSALEVARKAEGHIAKAFWEDYPYDKEETTLDEFLEFAARELSVKKRCDKK